MIGRFVKKRGGSAASGVFLAVLIVTVAVAAFRSNGVPAIDYDLNDAGIWITRLERGALGRVNAELEGALDTSLAVSSDRFDVLQRDRTVLVHDQANSSLRAYEPATTDVIGETDDLPEDADVALGGDTVAVLDRVSGAVWVAPASQTSTLDFEPASAVETIAEPSDADLAVGVDGTVHVVDGAGKSLRRYDASGVLLASEPLPRALRAPRVTAVGDRAVVLDVERSSVLLGSGEELEAGGIGADPVLQQPGPANDGVVVTGADGMTLVPFGGGAPELLSDAGTGGAIEAVWLGGCAWGAWQGETNWAKACSNGPAEEGRFDLGDGAKDMRYRVNRGRVLLNEVFAGNAIVFTPEDTFLIDADDWDEALQRQDEDTESEDTSPEDEILANEDVTIGDRTGPNLPPVARDDDVATRPGRPVIVRPLRNDEDPNGDVMVVLPELAELDPDLGSAAVVDDGQGVQFTPSPGQREPASFLYTVSDGRSGGTASARITVAIRGEDENGAPQTESDSTVVVSGGTVVHDVLGNDTDPDGDPITLLSVLPPQAGSVEASPDGRVSYTAPGGYVGDVQLTYRASDGRPNGTSEGRLLVRVVSDSVRQPPVARPDYAMTFAGREAVVNVLANDSDANNDPLRLARLDDDNADVSPTFTSDGTVRLQTDRVGSYYFVYEVTDRFDVDEGLLRIDVLASGANNPPTAVRDEAVLRPNQPTVVDVLANDVDADGDVLVVRGVSVDDAVPLRVEVLERRLLRLTSDVPLEGDAIVSYTISDGRQDAVGTLVVQPAGGGDDQPPVANPDVATVRAGHAATIPVLGNDIDPDGDRLRLSAAPPPVIGAGEGRLFAQGDELRYLAPGREGVFRAQYTVEDPGGNKDTGEVLIQVLAPDGDENRPPEPPTVEARAYAGSSVDIRLPLDRMDPDGDTVFLVGIGDQVEPYGTVEIVQGERALLRYTAFPEGGGTDRLRYRVRDERGAEGTGTVVVGVVPPPSSNSDPAAVADVAEVRAGETAFIPVLANDSDPEGDTVALDADEPVGALRVDQGRAEARGSTIAYTAPGALAPGTQVSFDYGIVDGRGGSDRGIVTVTVVEDPAGIPPTAVDDVLLPTLAGERVEVDVRANDVDPDGDPAQLAVALEDGAPADALVGRDGRVRFLMPDRPVALIYRVTDAQDQQARAFVVVPLQPPSEAEATDLPPIADADFATTPVGQAVTVPVLEGDLDPEGLEVTLVRVVPGTSRGGQASVDGDQVTFTPDAGFDGDATFEYEIADPAGNLGRGSVAVRVTGGANTPPVVVDGVLQVFAGGEEVLDLATLVSDPDPDQELRFAQLAGAGSGLTASLSGSTLRVSAARGTAGRSHTLTYTVSDGQPDGTTAGAIAVTIVPTDRPPPVAVADSVGSVFQDGEAVDIPVTQNDIDPIGEGLDIVSVGAPSIGRAEVVGRSIRFTPDDRFGQTTFTYTVRDQSGEASRTSTATVSVDVVGKPSAPPAPTGTAESRTVNLTWGVPAANGGAITRYEVRSVDGSVRNADVRGNSVTFEGLRNGQAYRFVVIANNAAGAGPASEPSAELKPDAVPDAPAAPTTRFGDTAIDVSWTAPDVDGSPISGYTLFQSPGGAIEIPNGSTTSYRVTGLTNGTAYTFTLVARNEAGDSEESPPSTPETPAGVPRNQPAPTAVKGDEAITVSWSEPDPNGAAVTSYQVNVIRDGSPAGSVDVADPATRSIAVPGENGRTYRFTVVATNKAGPSAPSPESAPVVPAGKPKTIASVSATDGDREVQLAFSEPGNNGSEITRYEVATSGGTPATLATSRKVTGLTNGTRYTFTVRACNSEGCGELSPASSPESRPFGAPTTPSNIRATGASQTAIDWTWDEVTWNGREPGRYDVYLDGRGLVYQGLGRNVTTSGLSPGGRYTLRVVAINTGDKASAEGAGSANTQSPPPPTVEAYRGPPARKFCDPTYGCSYVNFRWRNFAPGDHRYTCYDENDKAFYGGTGVVNGSSGDVQTVCETDTSQKAGNGVYIILDDVRSNTADW